MDYTPEQIVISNGSKHAITNAFMAILNPGDEVIVPAPYWNSYIDIDNCKMRITHSIIEPSYDFNERI